MARGLFLCFLILGLSGCGPIYRTQQDFIPPSTAEGKLALNSCLHERQECQNTCDSIRVQCQQNEAMVKIAGEVVDAISRSNQNDKKRTRRYSQCEQNRRQCQNRCEKTYQACYQNVGGTIRTYKICVYNCDKQ